jgi:excisionase family DNA binding protein
VEELLSIKDAAKCLACSEAMLRKWLYYRRLPTVKIGRLTRIRRSDLEAWLRVGLQPARPGAKR